MNNSQKQYNGIEIEEFFNFELKKNLKKVCICVFF